MLHVFVGYDPREDEAFEVCRHSILKRASEPTVVTKLKRSSLEKSGLYWRKSRVDADGQRWDTTDDSPFSTEFSFSRFLVPYIARSNNVHGWVMFVDCDFMFFDDVAKAFDEAENQNADLCVVKHNYVPASQRKMDNCIQQPYNKKLWSSFMLFNAWSTSCLRLTPEYVNGASGKNLHQLEWIDEDRVGSLGERWNWIPGVSPTTTDPKTTTVDLGAVHWTEGGPCLPGYENVPFADNYRQELALVKAQAYNWKDYIKL